MGAYGTYLVPRGKDPETMSQELSKEFFDEDLADVTIECSGVESSVKFGIFSTKSGGCIVMVGLGAAEIKMPIVNASVREVDIRGIFR